MANKKLALYCLSSNIQNAPIFMSIFLLVFKFKQKKTICFLIWILTVSGPLKCCCNIASWLSVNNKRQIHFTPVTSLFSYGQSASLLLWLQFIQTQSRFHFLHLKLIHWAKLLHEMWQDTSQSVHAWGKVSSSHNTDKASLIMLQSNMTAMRLITDMLLWVVPCLLVFNCKTKIAPRKRNVLSSR